MGDRWGGNRDRKIALAGALIAIVLCIGVYAIARQVLMDLRIPNERTTEAPANTPAPMVKDGMVMVYMPGGTFEMGSSEGAGDAQPVHAVILDSA